MRQILGSPVDAQTRCIHYRSALDIIAIKFWCCQQYYPCYLCHQESADHPAAQWPVEERGSEAILCGVCRRELTIAHYMMVTACPQCEAQFNPGCRQHAHLYFEPEPRS